MTNLNDIIVIQLTPKGVKFYKEHLDSLDTVEYYPGLKGDMLTISLWAFANIFGQELWNGNPDPVSSVYFEYV
jgi:hypothetical protein